MATALGATSDASVGASLAPNRSLTLMGALRFPKISGLIIAICMHSTLLLIASCASSDGAGSDETRIRQVVAAYFKAVSAGNAEDAYKLFSKDSRARCALEDFAPNVKLAEAIFMGDVKVLELRNLQVSDSQAHATVVTNLRVPPMDTEFIREGGEWRIVVAAGGCE